MAKSNIGKRCKNLETGEYGNIRKEVDGVFLVKWDGRPMCKAKILDILIIDNMVQHPKREGKKNWR